MPPSAGTIVAFEKMVPAFQFASFCSMYNRHVFFVYHVHTPAHPFQDFSLPLTVFRCPPDCPGTFHTTRFSGALRHNYEAPESAQSLLCRLGPQYIVLFALFYAEIFRVTGSV